MISQRDRLIEEYLRRAAEHKVIALQYERLRTSTAQTAGPLTAWEIKRAEEHGVKGLR